MASTSMVWKVAVLALLIQAAAGINLSGWLRTSATTKSHQQQKDTAAHKAKLGGTGHAANGNALGAAARSDAVGTAHAQGGAAASDPARLSSGSSSASLRERLATAEKNLAKLKEELKAHDKSSKEKAEELRSRIESLDDKVEAAHSHFKKVLAQHEQGKSMCDELNRMHEKELAVLLQIRAMVKSHMDKIALGEDSTLGEDNVSMRMLRDAFKSSAAGESNDIAKITTAMTAAALEKDPKSRKARYQKIVSLVDEMIAKVKGEKQSCAKKAEENALKTSKAVRDAKAQWESLKNSRTQAKKDLESQRESASKKRTALLRRISMLEAEIKRLKRKIAAGGDSGDVPSACKKYVDPLRKLVKDARAAHRRTRDELKQCKESKSRCDSDKDADYARILERLEFWHRRLEAHLQQRKENVEQALRMAKQIGGPIKALKNHKLVLGSGSMDADDTRDDAEDAVEYAEADAFELADTAY